MNITGVDQQLLQQAFQATKGVKVPSIPRTLMDLKQELSKDSPDQHLVIKLITEDISLTGKILQHINSAAFGLKNKVTSIEHATVMLGIRHLREVIVANALRQALEDKLPGFVEIADYSNNVALAAKKAGELCGYSDPDALFIAGLFHQSGVMLLLQRFERYEKVYAKLRYDPAAWLQIDERLFQSQHPLVSFILGHHWKLPDSVNQAIALHLQDLNGIEDPHTRQMVACIQVGIGQASLLNKDYVETDSLLAMHAAATSFLQLGSDDLEVISEQLNES